jgi:hypothetical protein
VPWKLSSENFEWGIWFKKISLKELSKHIAQSFVIFRRKEEKKKIPGLPILYQHRFR